MNGRIDEHTEIFRSVGNTEEIIGKSNDGKAPNGVTAALLKYLHKYFPLLENTESRTEFKSELLYYCKKLMFGLVTMLFSMLFARAAGAMESYPLGLGFLCAQSGYAPFALIGLLIARIISRKGESSFVISALIGYGSMILLDRKRRDKVDIEASPLENSIISEITPLGLPLYKRVLCATFAAFVDGMIRIIGGGFLYYDMLGGIFGLMSAPFLCFALTPLFERNFCFAKEFTEQSEEKLSQNRLRIAMLAFGFIVIYSMKTVTVLTFSPSAVFALIFTFYAAKRGGYTLGSVTGLVTGLAYGIDLLPCFALSGFTFGIFLPAGVLPSAATATAVAFALAFRQSGFDALSRLAPDLIAGLTLYIPLEKLGILSRLSSAFGFVTVGGTRETNFVKIGSPALIAETRRSERDSEIEALSETLNSLAEIFGGMSERIRSPTCSDIRRITVDCFDESCRECKNKDKCWSNNYKITSSVAENIVKGLRCDGEYSALLLPEEFTELCERAGEIVDRINSSYSSHCEELIKRDRTDVFALDYKLISKLIRENGKKNEIEYQLDRKRSEQLRTALKYTKFHPNNIAVYGKRRLRVIAGGIELGEVKASTGEIGEIIENACGERFTEPQFCISEGYVTLTAASLPRYSVEFSSGTIEKENERVCGDSVVHFENGNGYSYALISDGMGSGSDAAISSRIATVFLRRMLGGVTGTAVSDDTVTNNFDSGGVGSNDAGISLEMLGAFMRGRASECFTTVDLLEIDRYFGIACFIKSGAAPSYVLRDGNLFKVSSASLPIGITKEFNAEAVRFELKAGDIIIMISDGIAETIEDSAWLAELAVSMYEENGNAELCTYSDAILSGADRRRGRRDDMSVCVIRINREGESVR